MSHRGENTAANSVQVWDGTKWISSAVVVTPGGFIGFANAGYNSWPSLTPVAAAVTVEFDEYQAATATLNDTTITITLNTPVAPGAFKLLVVQDGTGGRTITWATQGPELIYAPDGDLVYATGINEITLIGFIWDGVSWYAVSSSPMQQI